MNWLIAVLLLIPVVDVLLLIPLATYVGWPLTVLIVALTGLVGMLLVRAEGRHTLRTIQTKLAQGEIPTDELVDGGLLLVAGAFLLTPGIVTDVLGFLLVIPPTRYPIRLAAMKFVITPYLDRQTDGFVTGTVYTGGFPDQGVAGPGGSPGDPGGQTGSGDTVDIGEDAYDIGIDDTDEDT